MPEITAGILGGLGPLATVYFMDTIIRLTRAETDQQHLNMIVTNHVTIPDRTSYILSGKGESPLGYMIDDAKKLEAAGASFIAIPCNTSHYYYEQLCSCVNIPIVNILEETVRYAKSRIPAVRKVGILATDGTLKTKIYESECAKQGIACTISGEANRQKLMHIIYNEMKAGKPVSIDIFNGILQDMREADCGAIILGCTELSIIRRDFCLYDNDIIDSMEALALKTIELGKKKTISGELENRKICAE